MPRVPISESMPGQTFAGVGRSGAGLVAGQIAESVGQLADVIGRLHAQASERHARLGALEAQTDITRSLTEIDLELQQDPGDGTDLVPRGLERGQEVIRERLERIEDPQARELVQGFGLRALAAQADRHARLGFTIQRDVERQRLDELESALVTQSALGTAGERQLAEDEYNAALDAAVFHNEAERADRLSGFMERQSEALVMGLIDSGDPDSALDELQDPDLQIQPERRAVLVRAAEREREALVRESQSRRNSDLTIAIEEGRASLATVESDYAAGRISDTQRTARWLQAKQRAESIAADQAGLFEVGLVREGLALPDTQNPDYRKNVDRAYVAEAGQLPGLDFEARLSHGVTFGVQAGLLPKPVRSLIHGALRSGDTQQGLMATQAVKKLRQDSPALLADLPEHTVEMANLVDTFSAVDPDTAVAKARDVAGRPPAEREIRRDQYRELVRDDPNEAWLADAIGDAPGWFTGDIEIPTALQAEAEQFVAASFERHGSLADARQSFLDAHPGNWQVTEVGAGGARRWMRLAPEGVYGTGDSARDREWMARDLVTETRPFLPDHLRSLGDDELEGRLAITSDPQTDQDGTYPVVEQQKDGSFVPVLAVPRQGPGMRDEPQWLRWQPSVSSSPALEALRQQDVERGRVRRAALRTSVNRTVSELLSVFGTDIPNAVRDLAEEEARRAREAGEETSGEAFRRTLQFWAQAAEDARAGRPPVMGEEAMDVLTAEDFFQAADRLAKAIGPAADRLARRISPPRRLAGEPERVQHDVAEDVPPNVPRGTPTLGGGGE